MKKFLSFEHTFTQQEIEKILYNHVHSQLMKQDKDYKEATLVQMDSTYRFEEGKPTIDVVCVCDFVKMRKP